MVSTLYKSVSFGKWSTKGMITFPKNKSPSPGPEWVTYESWCVEIWKRFRKWGGIPSGLTQNVKDLLASREIENIFENSDFIYMLNQAQGDRQILAKQLGISPHQLSYVTHSGPGEWLLFFGNVIIPFVDHFPKDTLLYSVLTTRPDEIAGTKA